MYWPFSLPTRIETTRRINMPVDWAYSEYAHVIKVHDSLYYMAWDYNEIEEWCMFNFSFYFFDRVLPETWSNRIKWVSNGIGGSDEIFIVTNSDDAALLAHLKWA